MYFILCVVEVSVAELLLLPPLLLQDAMKKKQVSTATEITLFFEYPIFTILNIENNPT